MQSFTWEGRKLTYFYTDDGMKGMYFGYTADGIRTYKSHYDHNTMDMYHVNYVLDGTKIVSECYTHEITNATYSINYYYDANDSVIGFNYNGSVCRMRNYRADYRIRCKNNQSGCLYDM